MIITTINFIILTFSWLKRKNLAPFSIYNFYLASIFLLFLIPSYVDYMIVGYSSIFKIDIFFSIFIVLVHLVYILGHKPKDFTSKHLDYIRPTNFYILLAAWFILFVVKIGLGVGFQPMVMLDRILNPRNYTYIKEATGPITYVVGSISVVLMYAAFNLRSRLNSILAASIIFFLVVIPGSKATIIIFVAYYVFSITRRNKVVINSFFDKVKLILGGFISVSILIVISFNIMTQGGNSKSVMEEILTYQEEYQFSKEIINDGDYNAENTILGITDTVIAIIPRQIYDDKPYVGYYNRFWREKYDSARTARYHSSQFGILAEAFTFLGTFGIFVYAIITGIFLRISEHVFKRSPSNFDQFIYLYFCTYTYFYLRNGFLFFVPYSIIIQIFLAFICFRLLGERKSLFRWRN
jgi:oligosaccharide repeat unit polymerase